MGTGRNRRRCKRRVRREPDQRDGAARRDRTIIDVVLTAAERARALARFRSLRGQGGVSISFMAPGAIVPARNPAELRVRTSDALTKLRGTDGMKSS
jgi:hypothetical protein